MSIKSDHYPEILEGMKSTLPGVNYKDIIFLCIGTDRSTGDALGPLIGTELLKLGYNVYGTLENPVHAVNLKDTVIEVKTKNKTIVAIDACLGQVTSVGCVCVSDKPVRPGAGVNKDLGEVGDYSITGVVNVGGFMEYFVLQNTRLNLVVKMAEKICNAIKSTYPIMEVVKNEQLNPNRKESPAIN